MDRLIVCAIVLAVVAGSLAALPVAAGGKTVTVNTTADHDDGACKNLPIGDCTLREAIVATNATTGMDTIAFNIPGPGPHVLAPRPLPDVTAPVLIDGFSEPHARPNTNPAPGPINAAPSVVLSGANGGLSGLRFVPASSGSVIRGLVINGYCPSGGCGPAINVFASDTAVEGNFLGTDATGTVGVPNGSGVAISGQRNLRIGGTKPAQRNLISGNIGSGIEAYSTRNLVVQGNLIGTDASGSGPLPNGSCACNFRSGMNVHGTSINATIGGAGAAANVIAFNHDDGVTIPPYYDADSRHIRILGNAIFANGDQGIDLGDDGVTSNDPHDPDTGPNDMQNFPVLTGATIAGGKLTITGTLDSAPKSTFILQFFRHPFSAEGSSPGQFSLGQKTFETNGQGRASFSFTTTRPVFPRDYVTATATDKAAGNTSEFASLVQATST